MESVSRHRKLVSQPKKSPRVMSHAGSALCAGDATDVDPCMRLNLRAVWSDFRGDGRAIVLHLFFTTSSLPSAARHSRSLRQVRFTYHAATSNTRRSHRHLLRLAHPLHRPHRVRIPLRAARTASTTRTTNTSPTQARTSHARAAPDQRKHNGRELRERPLQRACRGATTGQRRTLRGGAAESDQTSATGSTALRKGRARRDSSAEREDYTA